MQAALDGRWLVAATSVSPNSLGEDVRHLHLTVFLGFFLGD